MSRIIFAILGLLGVAIVGLALLLDNPNAYKDKLSATFESTTGYGLEINGDIDWQYFPPIAISLSEVAVTTPKSTTPLASITSASVDLKLIPLLFGGSVEVSGLSLDGLTITAEVDKQGVGNWEVAEPSEASDPTATDTPTTTTTETKAKGSNNLSVDIGGVNITNASVTYIDQQANSHYVVALESFKTGALGTGITTDISGDLTFDDMIADMKIELILTGQAAINESLDEFTLNNLKLNSTIHQASTAPLSTTLTLSGLINTSSETAQLSNSEVSIGGMDLAFSINATDIFGAANFEGDISAPTFNARELLKALDADPGPMQNANALSEVTLAAKVKGNTGRAALTELTIDLDKSKFTGTAAAELSGVTSVNFDLGIDVINASDYMSPTAASTEAPSGASASDRTIEDSELLPISTLKEINVDGTFTIGSLTYDTWQAKDFKIQLTNRNQKLEVNAQASAYTGSVNFNLTSLYKGTPVTSSNLTVEGINIAEALEVNVITGSIALKATHKFNGAMMSDLTNSLDGVSTFEIQDGTLDVRAIKRIAALYDSVRGTTSGVSSWPDMLPFQILEGEHQFSQGIQSNQTFSAASENMKINGTGGVDYFANTMVYDLEATLLENVGGQFTVNPKIANVRLPLHCEGSLNADPMELCLPDRAAITKLIRDLATQEAKKKGSEALQKKIDEKVPEELKDAAKGLLKGLFNN